GLCWAALAHEQQVDHPGRSFTAHASERLGAVGREPLMSRIWRASVLMLVFTAVSAAAGGWAGVRYGINQNASSGGLDELLHHELRLSPQQQAESQTMGARFATPRAQLRQ